MVDKKILQYDQKMLTAWLCWYAGCSLPEYFGSHKGTLGLELQQNPKEYSQLLKWFQGKSFESYLELGVGRGGSFLLNVMFQTNLKKAIAVDNCEYWKEEQRVGISSKIEWLNKDKEYVYFYNSSTDKFFTELLESTDKFDCVFVDADHSEAGVYKDFNNALKYINEGGYIILHDIASSSCPGVMKLWNEMSKKYKSEAVFVHGSNTGIGIIQIGEVKKQKYGVVLVENREELIQPTLDRHLKYLPKDWGSYVVRMPHFSIQELNKLMTSVEFWQAVPFKKCLIIQHDSQLLREGIEEFLEWDMVGAPHSFCEWTCNGGLSLRTVSVMKEICKAQPYKGEGIHGNCDIYFSNILHDKPDYGKLAPRAINEKFSCESIFELGTLGEHAASKYVTPEQYQQIIHQYDN